MAAKRTRRCLGSRDREKSLTVKRSPEKEKKIPNQERKDREEDSNGIETKKKACGDRKTSAEGEKLRSEQGDQPKEGAT